MPRVKSMPKRRRGGAVTTVSGRRALRRYGYKRYGNRIVRSPPIVTNTASVRENYTNTIPDGNMTYFTTSLSSPPFVRAQAVAENYQEFRIKYCKLTFRPSADTFPIGSGPIPQLYFILNKYQATPIGLSLTGMISMGAKPIRFDDKNIVRAWKPTVLLGSDTTAGFTTTTAAAVKVTPWLSTNAFAGQPAGTWTASIAEHLGAIFYVTKPSSTTPTINYNIDVEVVFQFRRPLSQAVATTDPYISLTSGQPVLMDLSGNPVSVSS